MRRDLAREGTLVVACGALARELLAVKAANGLDRLDVTCLPAILHNRPERLPEAVRRKVRAGKRRYARVLVAYGDCGTGGALDRVLQEEGVERIDGAHCYAFYAGPEVFEVLMEEEIGTFFLTDYLARHFDRLVWKGLGLDRHPHLREAYFAHYRRVVYLAQTPDADLLRRAEAAAARLCLPLVLHETGLGGLAAFLTPRAA